YNVADQVLRLNGDAAVTVGEANVTAPQIKYDMRTKMAEAENQPGTGGRVHGTIPQRQKEPENKP
ncbi:MAG TPA: hypothetical protein VEV18_06345, partial [Steroidobacteraceae bacterium]|nr:hypothetical protein [Steroidobacteraceae bacterium]